MPLLVASLSSLFPSLSCFRLWRGRHGFQTLSTLRKTKKPTLRKVASEVPRNLRFENQKSGDDGPASESQGRGGVGRRRRIEDLKGSIMAGILFAGFALDGYIYKDQINAFLAQFSGFIQGYGPAGYALFVLVYAELEVMVLLDMLYSYLFMQNLRNKRSFAALEETFVENIRSSPKDLFGMAESQPWNCFSVENTFQCCLGGRKRYGKLFSWKILINITS